MGLIRIVWTLRKHVLSPQNQVEPIHSCDDDSFFSCSTFSFTSIHMRENKMGKFVQICKFMGEWDIHRLNLEPGSSQIFWKNVFFGKNDCCESVCMDCCWMRVARSGSGAACRAPQRSPATRAAWPNTPASWISGTRARLNTLQHIHNRIRFAHVPAC